MLLSTRRRAALPARRPPHMGPRLPRASRASPSARPRGLVSLRDVALILVLAGRLQLLHRIAIGLAERAPPPVWVGCFVEGGGTAARRPPAPGLHDSPVTHDVDAQLALANRLLAVLREYAPSAKLSEGGSLAAPPRRFLAVLEPVTLPARPVSPISAASPAADVRSANSAYDRRRGRSLASFADDR